MPEASVHHLLVMATCIVAGVIFFVVGHVPAPHGRHVRPGTGPALPERLGWLLVGAPAWIVFPLAFASGRHAADVVPLVFAGMWMGHALYRGLVDPWRRRVPRGRTMPLSVIAIGMALQIVLAYLNARWVAELSDAYRLRWLLSFRFAYGAMMFVTGLGINRWADGILRRLRARGSDTHAIPHGGLFDDISCPNYLGEIAQWMGWAIATWSPAGLAMALTTACLLVPRAVSHHLWLRREVPGYPPGRRAIVPHVL